MSLIKKTITKQLRQIADDIDADNSHITEEEGIEILSNIAHIELSKEQSCDLLNVRGAQFGNLINQGVIPKGRKVKGFKELRWYKDELIRSIYYQQKKNAAK